MGTSLFSVKTRDLQSRVWSQCRESRALSHIYTHTNALCLPDTRTHPLTESLFLYLSFPVCVQDNTPPLYTCPHAKVTLTQLGESLALAVARMALRLRPGAAVSGALVVSGDRGSLRVAPSSKLLPEAKGTACAGGCNVLCVCFCAFLRARYLWSFCAPSAHEPRRALSSLLLALPRLRLDAGGLAALRGWARSVPLLAVCGTRAAVAVCGSCAGRVGAGRSDDCSEPHRWCFGSHGKASCTTRRLGWLVGSGHPGTEFLCSLASAIAVL
jgi:hypothetical protein